MVNVDGKPNVRACVEPIRDGMTVKHQNAWPSLDHDLYSSIEMLDGFMPVGYYYKTFINFPWEWERVRGSIRNVAGLGSLDDELAEWKRESSGPNGQHPPLDAEAFDQEFMHADVAVVGGGPAGMFAALEAGRLGARVVLVDDQASLGGHLRYDDGEVMLEAATGESRHSGRKASELAEELSKAVSQKDRLTVISDATVFGLYEGNLLAAFQGNRLLKIRAQQIIVCTGSRQPPVPFHNNDLPGIMPLGGILRLARLYGVRAGTRAVVLGDMLPAALAQKQLREVNIEWAGTWHYPPYFPADIQALGSKRVGVVREVSASGSSGVHALDPEFTCDLVCLATEPVPANELLLQGGVRYKYESGRWQITSNVPGLWAAGGAAGFIDLEAQIADGRRRGRDAAAQLGYAVPELSGLPHPGLAFDAGHGALDAIRFSQELGDVSQFGKRFVCLCEDVTVKDIDRAVAEGFDGIETLKRYSTVGMGPCQGKMCSQTAIALCARATEQEFNAVGATTSRPPAVPVELSVLAAERRHHPVRRTPMHHWHQGAGARWLDAGQWKRPESYGDSIAEVRAVRSNVGLIDVSTLGKIEVSGADAAILLERIYLNEWAKLAIGRARYGVMCTEEGIVFDDGVGVRLGPDRFFLTATTGNAEAVFQWLELWRATWRLNATVRNRTPELAAMNLAGPRARDLLARLTSLDLNTSVFPYLSAREGEVAGVAGRLLRIGFVGELGYEIHCASCHGQHLWEAILAAGAEFGIKPFGVEAQRILRLEKGHLIVGQDTDALSDSFGAGLERLVRFDKPQFHGRAALLRRKELGVNARLIGFQLADGNLLAADNAWARQLEGCQVVEHGRPVGRVTSVRHSPTLEKYVGLAWVPAARAGVGNTFTIRAEEKDRPAVIVPTPFYDPTGERLKSDEQSKPAVMPVPKTNPLARTPLHHWHAAHGARFEDRHGWQTAIAYAGVKPEVEAARIGLGLADLTALAAEPASMCARFIVMGPRLDDLFRRVMQLDVRSQSFPVGSRLATMLARVEATLERSAEFSLPAVRIQVAWDVSEYVWERLMEAGRAVPITPIGLDALRALERS